MRAHMRDIYYIYSIYTTYVIYRYIIYCCIYYVIYRIYSIQLPYVHVLYISFVIVIFNRPFITMLMHISHTHIFNRSIALVIHVSTFMIEITWDCHGHVTALAHIPHIIMHSLTVAILMCRNSMYPI